MSFGLFSRQCFISWHSILAALPVTACQLRPLKLRHFRSSPGLFPPQRETLGRNPARTTSLLRRFAPTGLWSGSRGVENLVKSESGANLPQATALSIPGCSWVLPGGPNPTPRSQTPRVQQGPGSQAPHSSQTRPWCPGACRAGVRPRKLLVPAQGGFEWLPEPGTRAGAASGPHVCVQHCEHLGNIESEPTVIVATHLAFTGSPKSWNSVILLGHL